MRGQRLKLQGYLRNDRQGSFRSNQQLFEGIAGTLFCQPATDIHDIPFASHHFQCINLIARCPIFNRFVTSGISGNVSADLTTVTAAGIAGVQ